MSLPKDDAAIAAELMNTYWRDGRKLELIPETYRPKTREDGYAIADMMAGLRGERVAGWKIAATSQAGQAHINVDGPLAGRLFESRLLAPGARVSLGANLMKVAEVEFAFSFDRDLPRIERDYVMADVMNAVTGMHLSLEIPDSRFLDFTKVGAPSLIADTACADWLVLGPAIEKDWRRIDLADFAVRAIKNGNEVALGTGRAALGDPRIALTWLVNELCRYGDGIRQGDVVTTGTCVVPVAIESGDYIIGDYGIFGQIDVTLIP